MDVHALFCIVKHYVPVDSNGEIYYEAMQTYEIKETEGTYELSTWESVQKQPEMTVNNGIVVEEVEPSSIFNGLELQRLNVD